MKLSNTAPSQFNSAMLLNAIRCYHRLFCQLIIIIVNVIWCSVRERDRGQSYALSLSHHKETKHYKIDKRKTSSGEVFAIEEGPTFENLMDVSGKIFPIYFFVINYFLPFNVFVFNFSAIYSMRTY